MLNAKVKYNFKHLIDQCPREIKTKLTKFPQTTVIKVKFQIMIMIDYDYDYNTG